MSRTLEPLWPDQLYTTAASSGATIPCNPALRRLFPGARLAIAGGPLNGGLAYGTFETGVIQSVDTASITLTSSLSISYPAHSRVLPLIESDIRLVASMTQLGGGALEAEFIATEICGPQALPALAAPTDTAPFGTFNGLPVLFPGPGVGEWRSTDEGWHRDAATVGVGHRSVYTFLDPRPRLTGHRAAKSASRADAWNLLYFWDLCRGATYPFYSFAPMPATTFLGVTSSTTMQVRAAGPLLDWQGYTHVAVVRRAAGTSATMIRPISLVTRSGVVDTITLASALDSTSMIAYVGIGGLMRFDGTDLIETWHNANRVDLSFNVIELVNEGPIVITNL